MGRPASRVTAAATARELKQATGQAPASAAQARSLMVLEVVCST